MAGLIAALFGGRARPPDPDPLPGLGGVSTPPGPAGQSGFPGSTSSTRTFRGATPRAAKLDKDQLGGINNALGTTTETRQSSFRGDVPGASTASPRSTPSVTLPQTAVRQKMQHNSDAEFFGGPELKTGPGHQTSGGNPLTGAQQAGGHSVRDTETPVTERQPEIGVDTPGAQNVRNTIAERYKAVPGAVREYRAAPRGDLPGSSNTYAEAAEMVSVPSRFVFDGGGNQTYGMLREMPYGGRGNGARGADLNGQRYYATGQADQFGNAGQGDYGIGRERGGKRPVGFTEPAPWTANFYDTTDSVGTVDAPGTSNQAPNLVYVSPTTGRASNGTGRTS
jgi:hypothetical protein